jgi:diacylglycerol kinase (ATP)
MPKSLVEVGAPSRPLLILNSQAGGASASADIETHLLAAFPYAAVVRPSGPAGAIAAIERRDPAIDAVIVGGGDGSVSSILAPLIGSGLPLGVLPLGTANDFARSIGIADLDAAFAAIRGGMTRAVDIGEANERLFLNTIAIGLPAAAARGLTSEMKKRLGMFAAAAVIPKILHRGRSFSVEIEDDRGTVTVQSCIAVLAGSGRYIGGFPVAYDHLEDGVLHLVVARARSWWEAFSILGSALVRRLPEDWNVTERATPRCTLRTSRPLDVALDGDIAFKTPVDLRVHPGAIQVFATAIGAKAMSVT